MKFTPFQRRSVPPKILRHTVRPTAKSDSKSIFCARKSTEDAVREEIHPPVASRGGRGRGEKRLQVIRCIHAPIGGAKILIVNNLEERSRKRLKTMETHRAQSFVDAEAWDLDFWQRRTPDERLSALLAIHRDVAAVEAEKADTIAPGS